MLTALTTQILVMMYIMIFAAAIRLRYTQPDAPRAYKIPGGKLRDLDRRRRWDLRLGVLADHRLRPAQRGQPLADPALHRGDARS